MVNIIFIMLTITFSIDFIYIFQQLQDMESLYNKFTFCGRFLFVRTYVRTSIIPHILQSKRVTPLKMSC